MFAIFRNFNLSVAGTVAVAVVLLVSAIVLLLIFDIGLFADACCNTGGNTFAVVLPPAH
ncbi:MAG: hypothetical protein ACI9JL_000221 [Paracoccaceae bacterium]|jgi:hypothetical protein